MEWLRRIDKRISKARKRRMCSCCNHVIKPGELYEHQVFVCSNAMKPFVHMFRCAGCCQIVVVEVD